jgi:hypothetical protein
MISERDVLALLREVADETRSCAASPAIEQRLLQALTRATTERAVLQPRVRWFPAAAVSFVLLLMTVALVMQTRQIPATRNEAAVTSHAGAPDPFDGFVLVPGASSLPPLESASIVSYEMPLSTLRSYGLEIDPQPDRPRIDAEVLIGQDGYARAIRLMQTP